MADRGSRVDHTKEKTSSVTPQPSGAPSNGSVDDTAEILSEALLSAAAKLLPVIRHTQVRMVESASEEEKEEFIGDGRREKTRGRDYVPIRTIVFVGRTLKVAIE